MSQSATWDTMQVARDARLCGRLDVAEALQAEIDEDLPAYSHFYARKCSRPHQLSQVDFLEWTGTHEAARLVSVQMAQSLNYSAPIQFERGSDAIEMRMRYYHASHFGWNGVFRID